MNNLFNHAYPYLDEHELNLDWLIAKMKELNIAFDEFKVVNNITFSGQWDITKQYPAWTIVSDNNIGYVSLQPVPVGVVLTNGDYWVEVIDYTAQIAGLETRVINLEGRMDTAENNIATNSANINYLGVEMRRLRDKNVIFIGDSYADPNRGGYANGWITVAEQVIGLDASHSHIYQYAGAGFVGAGMGVTFGDLANTAISDFTDDDAANITDIVIAGGCNDADGSISVADIANAVNTVINALSAKFTNAAIRIAAIGGFLKFGNTEYFDRIYDAYFNYYTTRSYLRPILNGHVPMMLTRCYDADGIHPNNNGVIDIGWLIGSCVAEDKSYGNALKRLSMPLTATTGFTIAGQAIQLFETENGIQINSRENITITGTVSISAGSTAVVFATLEGNSIIATSSGSTNRPFKAMIPVNVELYGKMNTAGEIQVWYDTNDSKLKMTLHIEGDSVGGAPYNVGMIRIRPFNALIQSII